VAEKLCTKCKQIKDLSHFGRDSNTKSGFRSRCKVCRSIDTSEWNKAHRADVALSSRKWQKKNPEKVKDVVLKRRYGISLEEYRQRLEAQRRCCPICLKHESVLNVKMSVDHCHKTGKVRGLLCNPCNTALGFIKEDAEAAIRLAEYIKMHKGN
jgi:hypothetical protein